MADQNTLLKQQLAQCCTLLQNALRAEHALKIPPQLTQWLSSVELLDSAFLAQTEQAHLQRDQLTSLNQKQDQMLSNLKHQLAEAHQQHAVKIKQLEHEQLAKLEKVEAELATVRSDLQTSREQNKKLVVLLQRWEHKCAESGKQLERVAEENLALKEAGEGMARQLTRLEQSFATKLQQKQSQLNNVLA